MDGWERTAERARSFRNSSLYRDVRQVRARDCTRSGPRSGLPALMEIMRAVGRGEKPTTLAAASSAASPFNVSSRSGSCTIRACRFATCRQSISRPVTEITAPELLLLCRKAEARGHYEMAKRLRSLCPVVFRYAVVTCRTERDPAADLRGAIIAPKVQHCAAITDLLEIGGLMRAIDGYAGEKLTRLALSLLALTYVRPGELRLARWPEFDLKAAVWKISAARTKMRRPFHVPLSRQALVILREILRDGPAKFG
jgi:Phage integrase central domain/Phage integrase family